LGPSQHICGIVLPLFLPTFHHLPDEFELIVPVTETIDSVDFHIHTIPVTVYAKYQNIIKSGDIFRYQPIATITIPTSVGMDIAATFSTGDLDDEIMIGE